MRYGQKEPLHNKRPKVKKIKEIVDESHHEDIPEGYVLCGWCKRLWDGNNRFIETKTNRCADCNELHKVGRPKRKTKKYYDIVLEKYLNRRRE